MRHHFSPGVASWAANTARPSPSLDSILQPAVDDRVEQHLPFVRWVLRQRWPQHAGDDGLAAAGTLGLVLAWNRRDKTRSKNEFLGYARLWIEREIRAALRQRRGVYVPARHDTNDSPVVFGLDRLTVEPSVAATEPPSLLLADLARILSVLSPRDRDVIRRHYGLGCAGESLQQIADRQGLSRERIRQIRDESLNKLRRYLDARRAAGEARNALRRNALRRVSCRAD